MIMQIAILRPEEKTSSKKLVKRIMNKAQEGIFCCQEHFKT